jgi:cytochrome c oxidase cbb3-type subunit 1
MYSFIDTVAVLRPYYTIRALAGLMYLTGFIIFTYNMYMTITASKKLEEEPQFRSPMA